MLALQVEIDKNSGFCFGVVYAIEMAEEILDKEAKLYCLGDIVHNDEEVR
ncbi:MAG: 4-hydroxy-3-methylbut-2-enyl diphosphate reductase, partial [Thermonemataceae bacterium]|nr:4-hydroxy-3-methylbut-2-enyl diphosphate reductase [Thermonemataceae bacterium]